jgi:hypothetical protein
MASGKSFLYPSLLDLVRGPGIHLSIVGAARTGKSQTNRVVMPGRDKYVMKFQLHEERRVLC